MITIGRRDKIDLPEFGLINIEAKVDTGAYGSVLHCHHIEITQYQGKETLSFMLLDPDHPEYADKVFYAAAFSDKLVKSSAGLVEHRYTIKTQVVLFGKSRKLEFSLILPGRKFLSKNILIDVELKDVSFN